MKINVNVKRRFRINGKEYGSVEEMPDEIRQAFEKAMARGETDSTKAVTGKTKIIFNGSEYEGIDAMPPDVRLLYDQVMKAAEGGAEAADIELAEIEKGIGGKYDVSGSSTIRRPAAAESSFSPRALIVSIALAALIVLLYMLFRGR